MLQGIIVRMYWCDTDRHKLPHFHAYYGDNEAVFSLDGELIAGDFPKRQAAFVKAWALMHEDDLKANWRLTLNGEETYHIDPLR
jgi:hypothetical protein